MASADPLGPFLTEARFMAQIIHMAKWTGWKVYHPHDSRKSDPGYPDLTLCHGKHGVVFAELKLQNGRQTPAQSDWEAALRLAGARFYCWRPSDWREIRAVLQGRS